MHNIFIIAKREYLERVRTRSFLMMTLFIPVLMFGIFALPTLLANRQSNEVKTMVVVAGDRDTAEMIRSRIEQRQEEAKTRDKPEAQRGRTRELPTANFTVQVSTNTSDAERAALTQKVRDKQLNGFLWATPDAIKARKLDFVTNDVSSFIENGALDETVNEALHRNALKAKGLKDDEIDSSLQSVEIAPESPLGKGAANPQVMFYATLGMVMVMYVTVLLYGVNVMRSILEEKTSRIMEVMLSTASAKDLMAGKIMGVGAVGLTQVGIWALTAGIFSSGTLVATAGIIKGVLSVTLLLSFAVFFLLGYVLYSTLCAAVGSMVNSEQEAQQMQILVMMPLILSVIFIVNIFQHPSSPIAIFGSLFPFTAPLVMFARIALQSAPWQQVAISIAILVATIYGMVALCGRIYRIGILMYGKKPTLPEIMKWIRYA